MFIHKWQVLIVPCSACVMIDAGSNAVGLTLYNLSQSTNFSVGDIIAIPDPAFRHIQVTDNVRHTQLLWLNADSDDKHVLPIFIL